VSFNRGLLISECVVARLASASRRGERSLQIVQVASFGGSGQLGSLGDQLFVAFLELGLFGPDFSFGLGVAALVGAGPKSDPREPGHFGHDFSASKGTRPLAMAPTRPKCWPMTNSALWRYLMASSGLANWAEAGAARAIRVAAAAIQANAFMGILVGLFLRWGQWQRSGPVAMWLSLASLDKFRRNLSSTGKHQALSGPPAHNALQEQPHE
jgi:hypothetical protein